MKGNAVKTLTDSKGNPIAIDPDSVCAVEDAGDGCSAVLLIAGPSKLVRGSVAETCKALGLK